MIVVLASLPALGNFAGGILADWVHPSAKTLNRALHAATGIVLAVVAVEVMPTAMQRAPAWLLALAFLGGGGAYLVVEAGIERWQTSRGGGAGTGAWIVYVAVATDLVGDGLLIGTASTVSGSMGLALAVGQVLADIPEGFAVIANFRGKDIGRRGRMLLSASFAAPVLGAAIFAYLALREQSDMSKMASLVFVAGLLALAAVEDMLREAHDAAEDSRWSAISFLFGFALFVVVSGALA